MRAAFIFTVMAVLATRNVLGFFDLSKPILLCQPPAPVCHIQEQPSCILEKEGSPQTKWVCAPETLLRKLALSFPRKAVEVFHRRLMEALTGTRKTHSHQGLQATVKDYNDRTGEPSTDTGMKNNRITDEGNVEQKKGNKKMKKIDNERLQDNNYDRTEEPTIGIDKSNLRKPEGRKKGMMNYDSDEDGNIIRNIGRESTSVSDEGFVGTEHRRKPDGGSKGRRHHGKMDERIRERLRMEKRTRAGSGGSEEKEKGKMIGIWRKKQELKKTRSPKNKSRQGIGKQHGGRGDTSR